MPAKVRLSSLADHVLGFRTTANPDELQHGPQPYEGIVSEVCAAFGCLPDEAERQDWALVRAVLDYRNARTAVQLFNGDTTEKAELRKRPDLMGLLLEMHRAQLGDDVTAQDLERAMGSDQEDDE